MNIRPALYEDCAAIYAITQDPSVRAASTRSEPFTYEEHCLWWDRRFSDSSQRFYVAEKDGTVAGYIRYGRIGADAEVALAVAPNDRRSGIALRMLNETREDARQALGVSRFVALVVVGNDASSGLFARAGFTIKGWQERFRKQHQRWEVAA